MWTALPSSISEAYGGVGYIVYESDINAEKLLGCHAILNDIVLPQTKLSNELDSALQKLVAQQQIHTLGEADAVNLSVKLGLVNRFTSFVMVSEQIVANADGLPRLEIVPNMSRMLTAPMNNGVYASRKLQLSEVSNKHHKLPGFLRRENTNMNESSMLFDISPNLSESEESFESTLLMNADKKLKRTFLRTRLPNLKLLIKWGLEQDLADVIEEFFAKKHITKTRCYISAFLLWLNEREDILSETSIELLQSDLDSLSPTELLDIDAFNQVLEGTEKSVF
jgi:hypothetical protein